MNNSIIEEKQMGEKSSNVTLSPFLYSLLSGARTVANTTNSTNIANGANSTLSTTPIGTLVNTTSKIVPSNSTAHASELEIHRANFVWPEDPVDEIPMK